MLQIFDTRLHAVAIPLLISLLACNSDEATGDPNPVVAPDGGSSSPPPSSAPDAITETVLAACPQSATLIESTEWPSCLAGRRVSGTEPFNNSACELRIGQSGALEYWRNGALALAVPDRSGWGSASGTYQNQASAGRRIFLAGVSPDLSAVEGEPRILEVNLAFLTLADDKVEIQYLDASLRRQTYTCQVNVL